MLAEKGRGRSFVMFAFPRDGLDEAKLLSAVASLSVSTAAGEPA
jgi:hypothetical protein